MNFKFILLISCFIFTLISCSDHPVINHSSNPMYMTTVKVITKVEQEQQTNYGGKLKSFILVTDTINIMRKGKLHLEFGSLHDDENYFVGDVITFSILEDKIFEGEEIKIKK